MTRDPKTQRSRNKLIKNKAHKLLQIKELLEKIIIEASPMPPAVKQAIESAIEISWNAFKEEQEKTLKQRMQINE